MKNNKKELLDRLLEVDKKYTEMVLDLINKNGQMSEEKWNALRLTNIDNLRRANIDSIVKVALHLNEENHKIETN